MNPRTYEREQELNRMIQQQRALEAFERFYDEDVVMQENSDPPTVGKSANRQRERSFFQNLAELKDVELVSSAVNHDHSFSEWRYDMVFEDGHRSTLEEIAVREWKDGQVVKERFYYERHNTARPTTPRAGGEEPESVRAEGDDAPEIQHRPMTQTQTQAGVPQERLSVAPEDLGARALEDMTEAPAVGSGRREPEAIAVNHADAVETEAAVGAMAGNAPPLGEPTSTARKAKPARTMTAWADRQEARMRPPQDPEARETAEASEMEQDSDEER